MTHQQLRSSGWRFQAKKKISSLISFTGSLSSDSFQPETIAKLSEQVQALESEDLSSFLKVTPNVWQLIKNIPHSIPLIEVIYVKCEELKGTGEFPSRSLHADELFCRLIWWIAYSEQDPHSTPNNEEDGLKKSITKLKDYESGVQSIVKVLARQCPELIERAHSDRRQLTISLETLGCHGLVNCSSGLIRLNDAVQLEVQRHSDRVKNSSLRVKEIFEKGSSPPADPSNSSHQRQMNLRLSEIFDRLKHNEAIETVLEDVITSHHLSSLLRIVRKRVASDRLLIGLFNAFGRASPEEFSFEQVDPVVAKLIVVFNGAYDKILGMCQANENDSGCSGDSPVQSDTEGGNCSSPFRVSTLDGHSISRLSKASIDGRPKAPRLALPPEPPKAVKAKSVGNVSDLNDTMRRLGGSPSGLKKEDGGTLSPRARTESPLPNDDTLRLRLHINHLKSELSNARRQIDMLMQSRTTSCNNNNRLWPEPDYPDATSYYNCSSQDDVKALIVRFRNLYTRAVDSVMPTLDQLSEFRGSPELQQKTVLTVIVLTYRSVLESVQKRMEKVWEIMEEGEKKQENEDSAMMDLALCRYMYRRSKSQNGMANAKEVTSQIWQTLYDFPSLKTCTGFNRFVLECVDVSWDIVAGIDGRFPRLRLEWEETTFDEDRHRRSNGCDFIQSNVRACLWPALVDPSTARCLLKAVVLT